MWSEEIIEVNIYKYELMMQYTKDNTGMNSLKKMFVSDNFSTFLGVSYCKS